VLIHIQVHYGSKYAVPFAPSPRVMFVPRNICVMESLIPTV
jgi:hypothetical protein